MTILRRLVIVTPNGGFQRRVSYVNELPFVEADRTLLDRLVSARLVVVSGDLKGNATVELVHEAIITAWPSFHAEIERESEFLRLRTRLGLAAERWLENGQKNDFLYPDGELRALEADDALARHRDELSTLERAFVEASRASVRKRLRRRRALLVISATTVAVLLGNQTELFSVNGPVVGLAFSPDGTALFVSTAQSNVIIDVSSGVIIPK
jgi:hypothetical protein